MKAQPLVSLIVPVFNTQTYLHQCLKSIAEQTYSHLEVICINDGSTDQSGAIIDEFAHNDARFIAVHKTNEGYGTAINTGLAQAKGTYIGIVESDDYLDVHFCEHLVETATRHDYPDIVKASYWRVQHADTAQEVIEAAPYTNAIEQVDTVFTIDQDAELLYHHPSIWSALYAKSFLSEYAIRMMEVPGAGWTDNPWLIETMVQARSIVYIDECLYYYREMGEGSSSQIKDPSVLYQRWLDMDAIIKRLDIKHPAILDAHYSRGCAYLQVLSSQFDTSQESIACGVSAMIDAIDTAAVEASPRIPRSYKLAYVSCLDHYFDSPYVSVIIPTHNSMAHLRECMESALGQTLLNIEVICVDDESEDDTVSYLHSLQEDDPRIVVLEQKQAGPGVARNRGLEIARGEYVYCLDHDDYCNPSFLKDAYELAQNTQADVVVTPFVLYNMQVGAEFYPPWSLDLEAFPRTHASWRDNQRAVFSNFKSYPWNKLVKRALIEEHNIAFQDIYLSEDMLYSVKVILNARSISTLENPYVVHREGTSTNLMSHKDDHPFDFITAFRAVKAYLDEHHLWPDLNEAFRLWAVSGCYYNLMTLTTPVAFHEVFTALQHEVLAEFDIADSDTTYIEDDELRGFMDDLLSLDEAAFMMRSYTRLKHMHDIAVYRFEVTNHALIETTRQRDDWITWHADLNAHAHRLADEIKRLEEAVQDRDRSIVIRNERIQQAWKELDEARAELDRVYASRDWRIGQALLKVPRKIKGSSPQND